MLISRREDGDVTVVELKGVLDIRTAPSLKTAAVQWLDGSRRKLVLDLAHIELIDSSGISAVLGLFKRANALGGRIKAAGLSEQPKIIFDTLQLDRFLDLVDDVHLAVSAMSDRNPE